jgi:hypothetical protein
MAKTDRDVSTRLGSEIFLLMALDTKMTRPPVGQISRLLRRSYTLQGMLIDMLDAWELPRARSLRLQQPG